MRDLMPVFEKLELWLDPIARQGPEAMAVDEWLLETATSPVLRIYEWAGEWASLGYFGKCTEASEAFPGLELVRRWTGGGMVDHRSDWTYSLVVPQAEPLAKLRGAASYGRIHRLLGEVLQAEGVNCELSAGEGETGAASCFENPVGFDLVAAGGKKLAGAGQRRSRAGLLHQGSVAMRPAAVESTTSRSQALAELLAGSVRDFDRFPALTDLAQRVKDRYSNPRWTSRR